MSRPSHRGSRWVRSTAAVAAIVLLPLAALGQPRPTPGPAQPAGSAGTSRAVAVNPGAEPLPGLPAGNTSAPTAPTTPAAPATPTTGSVDAGDSKTETSNQKKLVALAVKLGQVCRDSPDAITSAITPAIEAPLLAEDAKRRLTALKGRFPSRDEQQKADKARDDIRAAAARKATAAATTFQNEVCAPLCRRGTTLATTLDVCRFEDPVLASAAAIADWGTVESIARHVQKHIGEIERAAGLEAGDLARSTDAPATRLAGGRALAALAAATTRDAMEGGHSGGLDFAAISARLVETGLAALAKVIEDRAKREGLVWFLETMRDNLCGTETDAACQSSPGDATQACQIRAEVRTHWFPATCALASHTNSYLQYGGGSDLVKALRGSLASDLRGWPGAASGLGVGAAYWKIMVDAAAKASVPAAPGAPVTPPALAGHLMTCSEKSKRDTPACKAANRVRIAGAKLVTDFIAGANAAVAFDDFAGAIDAANRNGAGFRSDGFQMAACAAAIPLAYLAHGDAVRNDLDARRFDQAEALLLAALAGTPACFAIVGQGVPKGCNLLGGSHNDCTSVTAISTPQDIERLSTILRWADHADGPARAVLGAWDTLRDAAETYRDAAAEWKKASPATAAASPPDFAKITDKETLAAVVLAAEKYLQDSLRIAQKGGQVKLVRASVNLARAATQLGVAITAAGEGVANAALYPGLCGAGGSTCTAIRGPKEGFTAAREVLSAISADLSTVDSALAEDWGEASGRVIASVKVHMDAACEADEPCRKLAVKLSRYTGVFVALASETDPDRVARVLDDAAMPVGGWRRKLVDGSTMVSLGSIPGLALGGEARWGQYGARRENGVGASNLPYFVSPTLVMPVGLDVSRGHGTFATALFISLLDPAAYLQYDSSEEGRLPGAQILTALAPGLWGRVSLGESPFGINAYAVFRPKLRAWEPAVAGPAADAFQLGVSLSVDVTLLELYTGEASK